MQESNLNNWISNQAVGYTYNDKSNTQMVLNHKQNIKKNLRNLS